MSRTPPKDKRKLRGFADAVSWSRLSEQTLRVDKWSPAGVRLPGGAAAG